MGFKKLTMEEVFGLPEEQAVFLTSTECGVVHMPVLVSSIGRTNNCIQFVDSKGVFHSYSKKDSDCYGEVWFVERFAEPKRARYLFYATWGSSEKMVLRCGVLTAMQGYRGGDLRYIRLVADAGLAVTMCKAERDVFTELGETEVVLFEVNTEKLDHRFLVIDPYTGGSQKTQTFAYYKNIAPELLVVKERYNGYD